MTEQSAVHHHQKIKAEWTKSANSEIIGKSEDDEDNCKIKIINQIVLFPRQSSKTNQKKKSDSKKCGICERSFPNLEAFKEHQEAHENTFYDCPESDCTKKFKRKSSLRKHLYFHKGKFKYSCNECGENFVDLVKYEVHLASKHQRIERIFNCQLCAKTFTSADYLKRHQVTHKDEFKYSCKTCNQKFKWLTSLQSHTQIHTQNKTMMQCQDCQKTFFNQRTLDRHMKIHQDIKYQCGICKIIASNRKDNILRHIKHLHSEIPKAEVVKHVKEMERKISKELIKDTSDEINKDEGDDDDDEDNVLVIDESIREEEDETEEPPAFINNRVNVIQSIGNPHKNVSCEDEIRLPPKKKTYNPIAQYRAILLGSNIEEENSRMTNNEEVFPDHWRKRTFKKFSI